jgi:hypothetical protein
MVFEIIPECRSASPESQVAVQVLASGKWMLPGVASTTRKLCNCWTTSRFPPTEFYMLLNH